MPPFKAGPLDAGLVVKREEEEQASGQEQKADKEEKEEKEKERQQQKLQTSQQKQDRKRGARTKLPATHSQPQLPAEPPPGTWGQAVLSTQPGSSWKSESAGRKNCNSVSVPPAAETNACWNSDHDQSVAYRAAKLNHDQSMASTTSGSSQVQEPARRAAALVSLTALVPGSQAQFSAAPALGSYAAMLGAQLANTQMQMANCLTQVQPQLSMMQPTQLPMPAAPQEQVLFAEQHPTAVGDAMGCNVLDDTDLDEVAMAKLEAATHMIEQLGDQDLLQLAALLQGRGFLEDLKLKNPSELASAGNGVSGEDTVTSSPPEVRKKDPTTRKCTSLLVDLLPQDFDQSATMEWLDGLGYRDLYDFLMWFPHKHTDSAKTTRAFINFRTHKAAAHFRSQCQFEAQDAMARLRVISARQQGFHHNFMRYWHLTKSTNSRLKPYFAMDMVQQMTQEDTAAAEEGLFDDKERKEEMRPVESLTTVVIRNIPMSLQGQSEARDWLSSIGYGAGYDFFAFVPGRRKTVKKQTGRSHNGHIFVNYTSPELAATCMQGLPRARGQATEGPKVVYADVQGFEDLCEYFEHTNLDPWTKGSAIEDAIGTARASPKRDAEYQ